MDMGKKKLSLGLTIAALGVAFGDIGTSPLYALKVTLGSLPVTEVYILGILSLIFWSLTLIISIKYLALIFRADNEGEGGILALLALLKKKDHRHVRYFYFIAIFGAGLLLGDGMLTPAISVISAVEGLDTISPEFSRYVLPLASIILFFIFVMQSKGTSKIGAVFGPVILVWFLCIAFLGLKYILVNPSVLKAINPYYALHFLYIGGWHGYFLLGGIFLVVTGGEALYADIGHFGKRPIRYSWFALVFPALILNYLGQGAYLLAHPDTQGNPFFLLAPAWFKIPLLLLATCATIIASQAVISATFSLAKQAILLGISPRLQVVQTSKDYQGQIYVPQINYLLFFGTFLLLLNFQTSERLAHAYGIAVNFYMLLTTTMVAYAALKVWHWSVAKATLVFSAFFLIDFAFLLANSHKFLTGGWVPVFFAILIAYVMYTWSTGLQYLREHFYMDDEDIAKILHQLSYRSVTQLKGVTSIFITDVYDKSGGSFLHFLKLSMSVPEHVLIVSYQVTNSPHVPEPQRYHLLRLNKTVCQLTLHYGFMDFISIPDALKYANEKNILPFPVTPDTSSYIVDVPNVVVSKQQKSPLSDSQEKIFSFLMRNFSANLNIEFYNLPHNRTIAIGSYCLI